MHTDFQLPFPEVAAADAYYRDTRVSRNVEVGGVQINMNCQDSFGAGGLGDLSVPRT